jgi:RNA-directed DNA polymerase
MLRAWLKAGYWEKDQLFPTDAGTPQGGLISPLLSNLALDGMEQTVKAVTAARGDKVNFVRYADDFIVTGATRELLEQKVKPALTAFLAQRGLELSEQKTVLTSIDTGFDFLGHTLRKHRGKLLVTPAKSKVKILRQKIRQRVQSALGLTQEALLHQLNPLLRGWANYYRNGAAKQTFSKVDYYVGDTLWRWATRRHPDKSAAWKLRKYFSAAGPRRCFSVQTRRKDGEPRVLKLHLLASTKMPTPTIRGTPSTSRNAARFTGAHAGQNRALARHARHEMAVLLFVVRLPPMLTPNASVGMDRAV